MKLNRVFILGTAATVVLGPGLLRAAEAPRTFQAAQLHEQVRTISAASAAEYREMAELEERRQYRLNWDTENSVPAASAARSREQEQHRVQARRRLEQRLNSTQPAYGSAAYSDTPHSWSGDQRFGQGYEARMSAGQGTAAAGRGRSGGGRR